MKATRRSFTSGTIAAGFTAAAGASLPLPAKAQSLSQSQAQQIAEDAYIYGYSLITTEVTRVQMTNVPAVSELKAPMNSVFNIKRYPPADYRGVSAPNADTLYSIAWLDLGAEPIVFSHPDMGKRYYCFRPIACGCRCSKVWAAGPRAKRRRTICSPDPAGTARCRRE